MQAIEVKPLYIDTAIVISNIRDQHMHQSHELQNHMHQSHELQNHMHQSHELLSTDRLLTLAYVAKHIKFIQYRKVYIPRF